MLTHQPFMPLPGPALVLGAPTGIHWAMDSECCCPSLTREGCAIPLGLTWAQAAPLRHMDSRRAEAWLQRHTRDAVLQVRRFRWALHDHPALDPNRNHGWWKCVVTLRHAPPMLAFAYQEHGPMVVWMAMRG